MSELDPSINRGTVITKKTIGKVLKMYPGLGMVDKFYKFKQGLENENFKVVTAENKALVLKFYVFGRRKDSEIEFELSFIDFLSSKGIPAVNFYKNCFNQAISHINLPREKHRQVVVYEYIGGRIVRKPSVSQIKSILETLSQIHQVSGDYKTDLTKKVWTALDSYQEINTEMPFLLKLLNLPRKESKALIEYISYNFRRVNEAKELLREKLVVHGDLYQANIKFKKDKILGIFDFDECGYMPPLLDIGTTLAELYSPNITLNKLISTFLDIYQKYNSINPPKIPLIPTMMNMRYIQILYWTLKHKSKELSVPRWKEESSRAVERMEKIRDLMA